jgi:hypothetical protein
MPLCRKTALHSSRLEECMAPVAAGSGAWAASPLIHSLSAALPQNRFCILLNFKSVLLLLQRAPARGRPPPLFIHLGAALPQNRSAFFTA